MHVYSVASKQVAGMEQLFEQYRPQYVVLHAIAQVTPCTLDQQPVQAQLPRYTTTTHGECTFTSSSDIIQHRNLECVITSDTSRVMATRKCCLNRRSPYKSYRSPLPKIKRRARTGLESTSVVSLPPPVANVITTI